MTYLVTGGTGKTGRRVAEQLVSRGLPVRIGSRKGEPPFEWHDPATWGPVLRDVTAAYVVYYPDLAFPGAADAIRRFADTAVHLGVRRLVLLSGRNEPDAAASERGVRESGAEWTVMRSTWFAQDFSEHFLLPYVLSGVIALPAGDVPEPFVDVADVADVAVAALTEPGHAGKTYELTGPRSLTFADAATEISKASGREVRYQPVSREASVALLIDAGMPEQEAVDATNLFVTVLDGRNAQPTDDVRRVLGRDGRDFAAFACEAAATGVWAAVPTVT